MLGAPQRELVAQADQAMIQRSDVPRSTFSNKWTLKTTFNAAELIPIHVEEVLPGDHISYRITPFIRIATLLFPMMDTAKIMTWGFFIPNRIVWDKWKRFMGEQANPADSINFTVPVVTMPAGGFAINTIYDQMGLPCVGQIQAGQAIHPNALPLRGYNRCYNDWFRDQNMQNSIPVNTGDGPDATADYAIQLIGKFHDYFTSLLPWPQKFTAPTLFPAALAPIKGLGIDTNNRATNTVNQNVIETGGGAAFYAFADVLATKTNWFVRADAAAGASPLVYADLSASTGITINAFRQSMMIQALLEKDARGGTRYTELLRVHWGVTPQDARLQRPEYFGGGQTNLNITPVPQTGPGGTGAIGDLAAAGTAAGQHSGSYAATEHGFIIWLLAVRTELSYQQGMHRMWFRSTRYDYPFPSLMGLGEEAITTKEIYCTGNPANDEVVLGYQERWQAYRTHYNQVRGLFRSTSAGTIDPWHMAQNFLAAPVLGDTFIKDSPPMTRVLAAGGAANHLQYKASILFDAKLTRALTLYGTPQTLGRF